MPVTVGWGARVNGFSDHQQGRAPGSLDGCGRAIGSGAALSIPGETASINLRRTG
jgi:hypothetical protein